MRSLFTLLAVISMIALAAVGASRPAGAQAGSYTYFPTSSTTDARFLSIASDGLATLAGNKVTLGFAAAGSVSQFEIGLFDGDTGASWDVGSTPVQYTLYADPQGNGNDLADAPDPVIGTWSGSVMTDNGWFDIPVTTGANAQAPTGDYFYYLTVTLAPGTPGSVANCFKVRTTGSLILEAQAVNLLAQFRTVQDRLVVFPNYNTTGYNIVNGEPAGPTTYDGNWDIYFDLTSETHFFSIWDGDSDHSSFDGTMVDSDDQDTPNLGDPDPTQLLTASGVPLWAQGTPARPEGVGGGAPYDDNGNAPQLRRSPSIQYGLTSPDGQVFWNSDPSGNLEWEQFLVSRDPFDRSRMDVHTDYLPAGTYHLNIIGFDMGNLNAFRFLHDAMGVNANGDPMKPIRPYWTLGDRVWLDQNNNGLDDREPGIGGVRLALFDGYGNPVLDSAGVQRTTLTNGSGLYRFNVVKPGIYTVKVDASTLPSGLSNTSGGNQRTYEVVRSYPQQSFLDYDFGYGEGGGSTASGQLGDRVWLDADRDGIQDGSESGIPDVVVSLLDANHQVVDVTATDPQGNYLFTGLPGSIYCVELESLTLPAGLVPTFDPDGGDVNCVEAFLPERQARLDYDLGYAPLATLGDTVWLDANLNGLQDKSEFGIGGVTVTLLDTSDAVVASAITDNAGQYLFTGLLAGNYTVSVSTLPASLTQTFDLDGVATSGTAKVSLSEGENRQDADFGYGYLGSLGDLVWLDANLNGVQDGGEIGIPGVTVSLLNSAGATVATATTNASGYYLFSQLAPGTYTVTVSNLPADAAQTFDLDGIASAHTAIATLSAGEERGDVDFGYGYRASLGDTVWTDGNANGAQDSGEAGIAGVTVTLKNSAGSTVATTTTDTNGKYLFSNLAAGSYTVTVSGLASNLTQTFDLDGKATANTTAVALTAGQNRVDADFGYQVVVTGGKFTTYTQGGWGASPSGNNPGTVLANNFAKLFGTNLTVGGGHTLKFTSAAAVAAFLPSGGSANTLNCSSTNPTTSRGGVLAGQVLALQLNLAFSNAGVTRNGLGALKLQSGDFAGYTVSSFTALANKVLGGDTNALPCNASLADLVDAATKINENFDNGTVDKGFLK